ncbi:MAG: Crp/Fnr family transcriptional regulator [Bacteroidaceae bacterium]|jgi:CRP-like cAMP-binding protein
MEYDLYNHPFLQGCPAPLLESLATRGQARAHVYAKGQPIALQGQPCRSLLLLCSGSAYARIVSPEGRELTLSTLHAPDVLAAPFLFSSRALYPLTIVSAADGCQLRPLGRDVVERLTHDVPSMSRRLMNVVADHGVFLAERLAELALQTLSERVCSYVARHGTLTHLQQAASTLGVARPSLSRVVAQLVREGQLRKTPQGYELA